jgi:cytochrome c-type biogenesis protein CcmH
MTSNPISIVFVLSALGLSLFVALVLIWPVLRAGRERQHSLLDLNVQVFEERLHELEQDKSEGKVDSETFNALKTELERQLLSLAAQPNKVEAAKPVGRFTAVGLFLIVPVLAATAYGLLAYKPVLWHWWQVQNQTGPIVDKLFVGVQPTSEELEKQNLADFARVMQLRLQDKPNNPDGWYMLGMAFLQGELVDQAAIALGHANRLDPQRDDIALAYAQTLVFSQRGQLSPLSRELLMQVLNKNPQHEGALLLMGMGAYRSGDYASALVFLPKLREVHIARTGDSQSAAIKEVDQAIALAKQGGEKVVAASGGIRVTVTVTKELLSKIQPTDTIFIFARALNGPPMPLAVVRQAVGSFPLTVELNDSQSMIPDMKLSKFPSVVVNARISKSGMPQGASGDLEAVAVPLTQDGKLQQVELIINQVKP